MRWGGEEFLALGTFPNRKAAVTVAEELRRALREHPAQIEGRPYAVTISVGICLSDGPISRWDELVRRADHALYAAKSGGRDRVCTDEHLAA